MKQKPTPATPTHHIWSLLEIHCRNPEGYGLHQPERKKKTLRIISLPLLNTLTLKRDDGTIESISNCFAPCEKEYFFLQVFTTPKRTLRALGNLR